MGFLSRLVNDVKSVFGGGNSAPAKKNQQNNQNQVNNRPIVQNNQNNQVDPNSLFLPENNRLAPDQAIKLNRLNPNALQKVAPPAPTAQPDKPHASIIHDLTHNPVTNFAGSTVKSTVELGNAAAHVPQAIYREVQNKPIDDIQRSVFKTNDSGKIAKKIIGDTLNTALLVVAPGTDAIAGAGVKTAVGETAAQLAKAKALQAAGLTAQDAFKMAVTDGGASALTKIAPKAISGATIGGATSATNTFSEGGNLKQIAKSGAEGAAIGGVTGGVFGSIPVLNKLAKDKIQAKAVQQADPAMHAPVGEVQPTEAAVGISKTNAQVAKTQAPAAPVAAPVPAEPPQPTVGDPNLGPQVSAEHPDAAKIVAANAPKPVEAPAPVVPQEIVPHAMNDHEQAVLTQLSKEFKTRALSDQEKTTFTALQTKAQAIQHANAPVTQEVPKYASPHNNDKASVPGNNAVTYTTGDKNLDGIVHDSIIAHKGTAATAETRGTALDAIGISTEQRAQIRNIATNNVDKTTGQITPEGVAQIKAVVQGNAKVTKAAEVTTPSTSTTALPKVKAPTDGTRIPNAPGVRDAKLKNLEDLGAKIDPKSSTHDQYTNKEVTQAGKDYVNTLSDKEVVENYKKPADFRGPADLAEGSASLERLNKILNADPNNAEAQQALENVMQASEKEISLGGQTINYAKEFYENLKGPAKAGYTLRKINQSRDAAGLPTFDKVEEQAAVKANLTKFFSADEELKAKLASLQDTAITNTETAKGKAGTQAISAQGESLQSQIAAVKREISTNTAELKRYSDRELLPPKVATQTKIGNLTRSLMLSSPTGRTNDVITTAIKAAHELTVGNASALLGKVGNAVTRTPGKYDSTFFSPKALIKGTMQGAADSRQRFAGNYNTTDASQLFKNTAAEVGGKGDMVKSTTPGVIGAINRKLGAFTEVATDLSKGVETARVQQQASNEAKKLGLAGEDFKSYTSNRTAAPSRDMVEKGKLLHQQVNNMNDNPLSTAFSNLSNSSTKLPYIGETIKNLTLPFSRWTGGQLWSNLVDNNVAVSFSRAAKAAVKGDTQEALNQSARTAVNTVGMATLGFKLAQSGMIVDKNAEGYNSDGAYVKLGGRYIPLGFFGSMTPGLLLGYETHKTLSDPTKKNNIAQDLAESYIKSLLDTAEASGANSITGTQNPIFQSAFRNGLLTAKTGQTAAGQLVNQNIPAAAGDVNSVLNNGLQVGGKGIPAYHNPNHEAALTKVEDPNSKSGKAKDLIPSLVNQTINRVPFASQHLPRKVGSPAPDLLDRTTRGDHSTSGTLQKVADAKTTADKAKSVDQRIADNVKAGIPDPNANDSSDKSLHYAKGDTFENAVENRIENKKYDQAIAGLQLKLDSVKSSKDVTTKQTDPIQKQLSVAKVLKAGKYEPTIRDDYKKVGLTEWRNLGDPESDTYDLKKYTELYNFDLSLAHANASGNTNDESTPQYSEKKLTSKQRTAGANKGATAAANLIKSNTISGTTNLGKFDMAGLSPEKITDQAARTPIIQEIPSSTLIKKRSISVSKSA